MGGNCAICWGEMTTGHDPGAAPPSPSGSPEPHATGAPPSPRAAGGDGQPREGGPPAAVSREGSLAAAEERPRPQLVVGSTDGAPDAALPGGASDASSPTRSDDGEDGSNPGMEEPPEAGFSLPCSHAYHESCLHQWLHQCHAQVCLW